MLEAVDDLESLNRRRKALIIEVRQLKRAQEINFSKIHQDVATYVEDHADKYFGAEGEFKDKTFAQRFESSLKSMKSELRSLEQFIGINLHDMDEEMDRAVSRLMSREKEFDQLEEALRTPLQGSKGYNDLLSKFMSSSMSIDAEKEYGRLYASIARKEKYEEHLAAIISKREKQLEKELGSLRQVFREQGQQKRSLLETVYQHGVKDIDARRRAYRENIDRECEALLQQGASEQADLHRDFMHRYQQAMLAFRKGGEGAAAEPDSATNWKTELVDKQERVLQHARESRETQHSRDQDLLQQLRASQPIVIDASPLADLSTKLAALYLRYNDAITEGDRRRF